MTSISLPKSIIVILVLFFSNNLKAQDTNDSFILQTLILNESLNNNINFYFGNIKLKSNDVLEGEISLNHLKNGKHSAILKTEDGCRYISNTEIVEVVLFSNYNEVNESTRFIPLEGKEDLYRELYVKDSKNAIYDSMEKPFDGKIMSGIYILENNTLKNIFNFWHSGPKADLLNYFEDRDQKKYRRRDYKKLETLFAQL